MDPPRAAQETSALHSPVFTLPLAGGDGHKLILYGVLGPFQTSPVSA